MESESSSPSAPHLERRSPSPTPRWVRALRDAYLILSGTLFLFFVLEVGCRAFHRTKTSPQPTTAAESPAEDVTYTLHPYFQTQAPPSAQTLRGPYLAGWSVFPPDTVVAKNRFRILFLGGSTTATKYPELVGKELETSIGPVTVYNLGFDWHCSLHSLYKIWTYADDIRPYLTIALEGINDFFRGFTPPRLSLPVYRSDYSHYSGPLYAFWIPGHSRFDGRDVFFARPAKGVGPTGPQDPSLSGLLESIVEGSALLHALGVRPRPVVPTIEAAPLPSETLLRALPDYERNMRNLVTSCETKHLPLLLLTMPYTTGFPMGFLRAKSFFTNDDEHTLSEEDFAKGMDRFNAATIALRDEPAVHVFTLGEEIRDKALFKDEVHLKPEGLEIEARAVARYIVEHGLLREPRNR
jgi:hypothetical protein